MSKIIVCPLLLPSFFPFVLERHYARKQVNTSFNNKQYSRDSCTTHTHTNTHTHKQTYITQMRFASFILYAASNVFLLLVTSTIVQKAAANKSKNRYSKIGKTKSKSKISQTQFFLLHLGKSNI